MKTVSRVVFTILFLLAGIPALPVHASFYTGNELLADCSSDKITESAKCLFFEEGVVRGVLAADAVHGGKPASFKIPEEVTVGQRILVVTKYLGSGRSPRSLQSTQK